MTILDARIQQLIDSFEATYAQENGGQWSDEELESRIYKAIEQAKFDPEVREQIYEQIYTALGKSYDWE